MTHATIPVDRCYWAIVDASVLPHRMRRNTEQLTYLVEPLLPVPLEDVHVVTRRLNGDRWLACAVEHGRLESQPPEMLSLSPAELPPGVEEEVDPHELNLLTGDYTPGAVRRQQRLCFALALVGLLLVTGTVIWGVERRRASILQRGEQLESRARDVRRAVLGSAALNSRLPLPLQITSELRRLRQSRSVEETGAPEVRDVSRDLAGLLAAWPHDLHLTTESIHVTQDTVHVNGGVPVSADAQKLHDALADTKGWQTQHPSVRAAPDGFRAILRMQRREEDE